LPFASFASGVFGPVGSSFTFWPNDSPAVSDATDVAALGDTIVEFGELLPV